ncbi:MAG: methyltransferase domain-containing protein [Desulfuromonadales bacterium]
MLDYLFPDLRVRNTTDHEEMDRADADPEKLFRSIRQFERINFLFSASRRLLRRYVFSVMEQQPKRTYTLLDVGAGGCDISRWAAREARRRRLRLQITALDNNPRILSLARQAVRDAPEIKIVEGTALDLDRLDPFDFVFSNHLLHHLSWDEMEIFLRGAIARTRRALIVNDLKRSGWAHAGGTLCIGLLARRSFSLHDGRLSIRRGFLPEELRDFVQRRFPGTPLQVVETAPARVVLVLPDGRRVGGGRP